MSYHYEKETGDLVIDGFDQGISPSPHKGTANIQNANLATEMGEVVASFARVQESQVPVFSGSLAFSDSSHVLLTIAGGATVTAGIWITVASSSHTGELPNGNYYVDSISSGVAVLSSYYSGIPTTGFTSGLAATWTTLVNMGKPIAYAIETYNTGSLIEYRYYVLDSNALVWVQDSSLGTNWFLPDASTTWYGSTSAPTGIGVLNGWLFAFAGNNIWAKATVNLGGMTSTTTTWKNMNIAISTTKYNASTMSLPITDSPHYVLVGRQGKLYYTDGNYIGMIFPDTFLVTGIQNIQSYARYTAVTTVGTIANLYSGSLPWDGLQGATRIPAVFFVAQQGTLPSAITADTVYYIEWNITNPGSPTSANTFNVYADASDGSALDMATGSNGLQYFNTFYPFGVDATPGGATSTTTFVTQKCNLPANEISTCMGEIGNTVIIGGVGNTIYPWNQIDATPSTLLALPETGTSSLVNVHNMMYVFAGNKGNIYITDGSVVSHVYQVPDYCAGIPGSPSTYIEPYFVWGASMYLRGRVYFSILDQTASKAGNCGGIWSFVPTQNYFIQQDVGISLVLENQNSYGTYSGVATVLIPSQNQQAIAPQFWSGWYSSVSNPSYGIDFTGTFPITAAIIETDLIPTGTMLQEDTFGQIEYKLSAPLLSGETVNIKYRTDATSAYATTGSNMQFNPTGTAGYFVPDFEFTQWIQLQITLTPNGTSTFSGNRLKELRIRQ